MSSKQPKAKPVNTPAPKPAETQAPVQDTTTPAPADQDKSTEGAEQGATGGEGAATDQGQDKGDANDIAEESNTGGEDNTNLPPEGASEDGAGLPAAENDDVSQDTPSQESTKVEASEPEATSAPEQGRGNTPAVQIVDESPFAPVAEPAPREPSLDATLAAAAASPNVYLQTLGKVLSGYRAVMGESKGTDLETIEEQNAQLWAVLRQTLRSGDAFRDSMQLVMAVFRENADGAFKLNMLLRGVDRAGGRLNADHRAGFTGLVTLINAAAGMNNPRDVGRVINLAKAMESVVFTEEARQRVMGYFSA